MRRRQNALPRPVVRVQSAFEFELDGAEVKFTRVNIYGDRFTTSVPRDVISERVPLACALSLGLHLSLDDADELGAEVRRRLGA